MTCFFLNIILYTFCCKTNYLRLESNNCITVSNSIQKFILSIFHIYIFLVYGTFCFKIWLSQKLLESVSCKNDNDEKIIIYTMCNE